MTGAVAFPSMFSLDGQTALVTGGSRGIGQAMAMALAEAGANILLVQRDATDTATRTAIQKLGRKVTVYTADLSSAESVSALVPSISILNDGCKIDILLNCAGIQRRHPCHQFSSDDWNLVLQVNLGSIFTLCRDVGAHMLQQTPSRSGRRGRIINVASLMSFQGGISTPAYTAAKGGVAQLTEALSNERAEKGMAVNATGPGYVATDLIKVLTEDETWAKSILE